jgi:hypothetical protein
LTPYKPGLRLIFQVNQRAGFDFIVTENSFAEVSAKSDGPYASWVLDVFDHWLCRIDEYRGQAFDGTGLVPAPCLDGPASGYLSAKDRIALKDALALECDAFLTMEKKLAKNAAHLASAVGLKVLLPRGYWSLVRSCPALYC